VERQHNEPFVPIRLKRGDVLIYDHFMPRASVAATDASTSQRALFAECVKPLPP
jgi:hypothetical protein